MKNNCSEQKERKILRYSMFACLTFVILEIVTSIFTQSQSVLMDAVYDGCELVIIFISMRILPLLYKSSSEKHPYGFNQLESFVIILKGIMMLSVASGLLISNIQIMINGGKSVNYTAVAIFELSIAIVSFFTVFLLKKENENLNSPMIKAEIKGWLIDGICSLGMGFSFLIPSLINERCMPYLSSHLDQIVAIFLCLCILPYPIKLLFNTFKDIFLFAPEEYTMDTIRELTESTLDYKYLNNITYDVIRTGRKLWISIYFKPSSDYICVSELAEIQERLKAKMIENFEDIYLEILPDIEK